MSFPPFSLLLLFLLPLTFALIRRGDWKSLSHAQRHGSSEPLDDKLDDSAIRLQRSKNGENCAESEFGLAGRGNESEFVTAGASAAGAATPRLLPVGGPGGAVHRAEGDAGVRRRTGAPSSHAQMQTENAGEVAQVQARIQFFQMDVDFIES